MDVLGEIINVFDCELKEIQKTKECLPECLVEIIELIFKCRGRIVWCGMGKSGHVARKNSATMASLGIPSFVLHPAEAMHGDLGMITSDDIVLLVSNSGETFEICTILPNIRSMGALIVAITSNDKSTLANYADKTILLPHIIEADEQGLAPTSSTTVTQILGDALSIVVSKMNGFRRDDFALRHPAGSLGKRLTVKVKDIMFSRKKTPILLDDSYLHEAVELMCRTGLGAVIICDNNYEISGIITDGDLKRIMNKSIDIYSTLVSEVMSKKPICIEADVLAVDALYIMEHREKSITVMPVIDETKKVIGLIRTHDIIEVGITY